LIPNNSEDLNSLFYNLIEYEFVDNSDDKVLECVWMEGLGGE